MNHAQNTGEMPLNQPTNKPKSDPNIVPLSPTKHRPSAPVAHRFCVTPGLIASSLAHSSSHTRFWARYPSGLRTYSLGCAILQSLMYCPCVSAPEQAACTRVLLPASVLRARKNFMTARARPASRARPLRQALAVTRSEGDCVDEG